MADETPAAPAEAPQAPESVWKTIPSTEGRYLISNNGEVARVFKSKKRLLASWGNNTPYLAVKLSLPNNKKMYKYVHRLVAENFVPGYRKGLEVNHKNGDKTDNRASNLEWVTHSANNLHKWRVLKNGNKQSQTSVFTEDGAISFSSISECANSLGVSTTTVRRHLKGFSKTVKGVKLIRKEAFNA